MSLTAAQWKELEAKLCYTGADISLVVDGYNICIQRRPIRGMTDGLVVFINLEFKGIWISDDCEERRRFYRPIKKRLYKKPKSRLHLRAMKDAGINPDAVHIYYSPFWLSFSSLRRHLIKHNTSIQIAEAQQ